jgi:hypothetical protein
MDVKSSLRTGDVYFFEEQKIQEVQVDGINEKVARVFFSAKLPAQAAPEFIDPHLLVHSYQYQEECQDRKQDFAYWRICLYDYEIGLPIHSEDSQNEIFGKQKAVEFFYMLTQEEKNELLDSYFLIRPLQEKFEQQLYKKMQNFLKFTQIKDKERKQVSSSIFGTGLTEVVKMAEKQNSFYQIGKLKAQKTFREIIEKRGEECLLTLHMNEFLEKINSGKNDKEIAIYTKGFSEWMIPSLYKIHYNRGREEANECINMLLVVFLNKGDIKGFINDRFIKIQSKKTNQIDKYNKDGCGEFNFKEFLRGIYTEFQSFLKQLIQETEKDFKGLFVKIEREDTNSFFGGGSKEDLIDCRINEIQKQLQVMQDYYSKALIFAKDLNNDVRDQLEKSEFEDFDLGQFKGYWVFIESLDEKIDDVTAEIEMDRIIKEDPSYTANPSTGELNEEKRKKLELFKQGFKVGLEKAKKMFQNREEFRLKKAKETIANLSPNEKKAFEIGSNLANDFFNNKDNREMIEEIINNRLEVAKIFAYLLRNPILEAKLAELANFSKTPINIYLFICQLGFINQMNSNIESYSSALKASKSAEKELFASLEEEPQVVVPTRRKRQKKGSKNNRKEPLQPVLSRQEEKESNALAKINKFKEKVNGMIPYISLDILKNLEQEVLEQREKVEKVKACIKNSGQVQKLKQTLQIEEKVYESFKVDYKKAEDALKNKTQRLDVTLRNTIMKLCMEDKNGKIIKFYGEYTALQTQILIVCLLDMIEKGYFKQHERDQLLQVSKSLDRFIEKPTSEFTKQIIDGLTDGNLNPTKVLNQVGFSFF